MYDAMMTMGLEKLVKRTCNNNHERSRPVKMQEYSRTVYLNLTILPEDMNFAERNKK